MTIILSYNHWIIAGILLAGMEVIVGSPSINFLLLSIAGFITAALVFVFNVGEVWQVLFWAILSIVLSTVAKPFFKKQKQKKDEINDLRNNMIGKTFILQQPIVDGVARAHVYNSIWRIEGADMPKGCKVVVVDMVENILIVEECD